MLPHISGFSKKKIQRVPHTKGLPLTDINQYGEEEESRQWIGVDLMVPHKLNHGEASIILKTRPQYAQKSQGMD